MNKEKITNEIVGYDFELRYDIGTPKKVKNEEEFYKNAKEVMYISTQNDPSVGIFGKQISPNFKDFNSLNKWWKKNKKQVIKKYG